MWWNRKEKTKNGFEDLARQVESLTFTVGELRRAYDDLDDQFRRFRARTAKRMAVDERDSEAAPADGAARDAPSARNGKVHPPAELRAQGRWPWR